MEDLYIHYGSDHFSRDKFVPLHNEPDWVKPRGGLWASPLNSEQGWSNWVESSNYSTNMKDNFIFKLKSNTRILKITSSSQLSNLPMQETNFNWSWKILDFMKIAKSYDAMLVLISSDEQLYWDLYGWDCDTLLVFNPDVIEEVE